MTTLDPGPKPEVASWHVLRSGIGAPALNMAVDETLLEWVEGLGRPVLRFYGWSEPAATFGYFQSFAAIEAATALRPLIRRPTGGGLVPHDADWTYSVAIPPTDPWYRCKAVESYRRVHEWVQAAFGRLGVRTELAPSRVVEVPGHCFAGAEQFDLTLGGRKIAGAAQRRRLDGLLIQGSIQAGATGVERGAFETAFCAEASERWKIRWEDWPEPDAFRRRAAALASEKYSSAAYNRDRMSGRMSGRGATSAASGS